MFSLIAHSYSYALSRDSTRSTVLGQICNDRAVSRTPLALRLMSMIVCLTSAEDTRHWKST